jgi:hypothetical protein
MSRHWRRIHPTKNISDKPELVQLLADRQASQVWTNGRLLPVELPAGAPINSVLSPTAAGAAIGYIHAGAPVGAGVVGAALNRPSVQHWVDLLQFMPGDLILSRGPNAGDTTTHENFARWNDVLAARSLVEIEQKVELVSPKHVEKGSTLAVAVAQWYFWSSKRSFDNMSCAPI